MLEKSVMHMLPQDILVMQVFFAHVLNEFDFMTGCADFWVMDLGALVHICRTLREFHQTSTTSEGEGFIHTRSEAKATMKVAGDIVFRLPTQHIELLRDVFYSPVFCRNIIFTSRLVPFRT